MNAIFLLEFDATYINNTAASASHLQLCPDNLQSGSFENGDFEYINDCNVSIVDITASAY